MLSRSASIWLRALGVVFCFVGSLLWSSRLDFAPEAVLQERLGTRLTEVSRESATDLTSACRNVANTGGWILFVLNARVIADDGFRTYFETGEETYGLWVEYEPGLLRLGLGQGPNSPESTTSLPIRIVRRDESAVVVIGVSANQTRVITNGVDKQKAWPGAFVQEWKCSAVQVGVNDKELSQGNACNDCDVRLRIATSENGDNLAEILDSLSNVQQFNQRRILGSALSLLGVFLILFAPHMRCSRTRVGTR